MNSRDVFAWSLVPCHSHTPHAIFLFPSIPQTAAVIMEAVTTVEVMGEVTVVEMVVEMAKVVRTVFLPVGPTPKLGPTPKPLTVDVD